jgi:hypothetical protein
MKASKVMDGGIHHGGGAFIKHKPTFSQSLVQQWTQLTRLKLPFVRYSV